MTLGTLCLIGGDEWNSSNDFYAQLLEASGGKAVTVLATAAAYENPTAAVATATEFFSSLGATVTEAVVRRRAESSEADLVAQVREAKFIFLIGGPSGGSPMHLQAVLMNSPMRDAINEAWTNGAVLVGAAAGAAGLFDHMIDTRGGAFTGGLSIVKGFTMVPQFDQWSHDKFHRTLALAPAGLPVVGINNRTALIWSTDQGWRASDPGGVSVFADGAEVDLSVLPASPA